MCRGGKCQVTTDASYFAKLEDIFLVLIKLYRWQVDLANY
jgi:phosphoribosyl 1,2-cyclic phosphodiesterase